MKKDKICNIEEIDQQLKARPRSATLLHLKWLADRIRRACTVRSRIEEGTYTIDSMKVAEAMVSHKGE